MTQSTQSGRLSLVEMAVARSARPDLDDASAAGARRQSSRAGRRAYDATLKGPAATLSALDTAASPATTDSRARTTVAGLFTHVVSAGVGAALTWWLFVEAPSPGVPLAHPAAAPRVHEAPVLPGTGAVRMQTAVATGSPAPSPTVEVRWVLEQWRDAWSRRDVDAYLGFYARDFTPASGITRSTWAKERRENFASRNDIRIKIRHVTVHAIDAESVRVWLHQDYASGLYKEILQPKTFLFTREGGAWKIAGEWQGLRLHLPGGR